MKNWYVKRSDQIQAEQWDGVDLNKIWEITEVFIKDNTPYMQTKTGFREVRKGDYIVENKDEAPAIMPKEEFEEQYIKASKRAFKVRATTDIYVDAYNEDDALYQARTFIHPQTVHFDVELLGDDDE